MRRCLRSLAASIVIAAIAVPIAFHGGAAFAQSASLPPLARPDALSLRAVLDAVPDRNREVLAARRAVEAARTDIIAAGARPNPTVTLGTASINPQQGPLRASRPLSARVDQLIERGGKRDLRIEAARRAEQAASSDVFEVIRQQRLGAASAYFDLLLAQERVKVTQENIELFERTLGAAEQRFKAGDIAEAEVTRLRVDALRSRNENVQAQADRRRAQLALALLLALDGDANALRAADDWPGAQAVDRADLDTLIDRRPDVQSAAARRDAAQTNRELARRLRTRDVSIGAEWNRYPPAETNTLGAGTSVGVSVAFPIFAFYDFRGEIERAEVELTAASEELERTRAQARNELARAAADLQAAGERVTRFETTLLDEARRSAGFAEFAYRNGALGVMDLLDARRVLRATQLDAAVARADLGKARAAWEAAATIAEAIAFGREPPR